MDSGCMLTLSVDGNCVSVSPFHFTTTVHMAAVIILRQLMPVTSVGDLFSPQKRGSMFLLALVCVCVCVCDHDN